MALGIGKPEFPPLLPAGFHSFGVKKLRALCVDAFLLSTTRSDIMDGLEAVRRSLIAAKVVGQLWVDGSFMTQKIDPQDVDVVLYIDADQYDAGDQTKKDAIEWVSSNLETAHKVHSFVLLRYPNAHPLHGEFLWQKAYWIRQFGFSRADSHKGMAVLKLA